MLKVTTRLARKNDLGEIQKLFVDTITSVCRDDYSSEQIRVWTSSVKNKDRWGKKILEEYFLVAENEAQIVGYASLEGVEHLDLLYVHKDFQRQGIASTLYELIEKEAITRGAVQLHSDVSITAKQFFIKKGFIVVEEQKKIIESVEITNYQMVKELR